MNQLTVIKSIRFTGVQANSLKILESYNVNVSKFIREAVRDKLKNEWKSIKVKKEKNNCPF